MRVQILKDFVKQHFPSTQLLDYALDVEKITTSKVFEFPPEAKNTTQKLFPNNITFRHDLLDVEQVEELTLIQVMFKLCVSIVLFRNQT